jgi:hypothetical protein
VLLLTYLQHVRYPAHLGPETDVANTGIGLIQAPELLAMSLNGESLSSRRIVRHWHSLSAVFITIVPSTTLKKSPVRSGGAGRGFRGGAPMKIGASQN